MRSSLRSTPFFILLIFCTNQEGNEVASLETATAPLESELSEEDYGTVLTECLRQEGYNVQTPFDNEEMKQIINSFQEGLSKEKRIDFQEQIRICIERNDLWVERKTSNPEVMAELYDNNVGLAQCLRDKGVEVADPTQENPNINLQSSGMSREELKEKLALEFPFKKWIRNSRVLLSNLPNEKNVIKITENNLFQLQKSFG